jgi:hypothetical protein
MRMSWGTLDLTAGKREKVCAVDMRELDEAETLVGRFWL